MSNVRLNMKPLVLILACFLTFLAQAAPADGLQKFGKQMSYFYLSPSRESFNAFQQKAEQYRAQLQSAGNGADLLVAVMISKASKAHGWPIGDGPLSKTAKEISEGKSDLARYVANDEQVDPTKLDIWWASFFATGDVRFLENIFQFAGREPPKGDVGELLVVGAATWSFKANCRQHQRVLQFAKQKLASPENADGKVSFLKECVSFGEEIGAEPAAPGGAPQAARP